MHKKSSPPKMFLFWLTLFFVVYISHATGFSFAPMSSTIGSTGAEAVITYTVSNDTDKKIAVTIKAMHRLIDANGAETTTSANESFLIFPSRVVLNPMTSQMVKVQYRGPSAIAREAAYRIVAEQLPVDFTKSDGSAVNILLTYVAALYVSPSNALADVVVMDAVGGEYQNKRGIVITLKNKGTKHAIIAKPLVQMRQGPIFVEFAEEAASAINGQNILAGGERVFFLPWDSAILGTVYEGTFSAEIE